MGTLKRAGLALLALLFAAQVQAEDRTYVNQYDLNATTYTYCVTAGTSSQGVGAIQTSGSTTAVTAVSGTPFDPLSVGDQIEVTVSGSVLRRSVTAKASGSAITVSSAIDLTGGYPWKWRSVSCGTASTAGWIGVGPTYSKNVKFEILTEASTGGVDLSIECRFPGDGSNPIQIYFGNYTGTTAPTNGDVIPIMENCTDVRVGMKWHTADAGVDSVSAFLHTEPAR